MSSARRLPALPERDVHSPVRPARHGELPRAVDRVDDPDTVGLNAGDVVDRLLGEHGVVGPGATQAGRGSACWPACRRHRRGRTGRRSRSPRAPPGAVHRLLRPPRRPAPHRSGSSSQYHQPLGSRHHRIAALGCCDDEHSRGAVRFAHGGTVEGTDSVRRTTGSFESFTSAIGIADYEVVEASKTYIRATRRDGLPDLHIYYGYTTGFTTEEETQPASRSGAVRGPRSPEGNVVRGAPGDQGASRHHALSRRPPRSCVLRLRHAEVSDWRV